MPSAGSTGITSGQPQVPELDSYDQLLGCLYDAAMGEQSWSVCLERIREMFQANYVTLILRAPDGSSEKGLMIVLGDIEGQGSITWFAYPHDASPFAHVRVNEVFTVGDVMAESAWVNSEYFRKFCAPQGVFHVLGVDIVPPSGGRFRFRITRQRSARDFSAAEKALCERLIPHLSRVLQIHGLLGRSESLNSLYAQTIGRLSIATLVLDESGRILERNPTARRMLLEGDGLRVANGRLEACNPGDNRRLYQVLRAALGRKPDGETAPPEALSIGRPSGQASLGLVVESVPQQEWADSKERPALVVYVRDAVGKPLLSTAMTRKVFGFTPSETSLAMELANGLSLEEAANALGIRRNTARAHLRSIFCKTGVRRQTELVRMLLNSIVSLGSDFEQSARRAAQGGQGAAGSAV